MKIFPAIDLSEGKVVRLFQGDYDQMTVYSSDPVSIGKEFESQGASYLHVVDLDGAKDGELINFNTIKAIVEKCKLYVQVGGGIRDEKRIKQYLDLGVNRVILGTIAVENIEFVEEMVKKYGEAIAVGIDAKDGKIAIKGWKEITTVDSLDFCKKLAKIGVKTVIYTDISKDGAMEGTNLEVYDKLSEIQELGIIASGGISFEDEIVKLKDKVDGAILGKSLYTGSLDLQKVIELGK